MDEPRTFSASAPGNLMLFGEHAVLHNRHAIVCAVNRRIKVTITPRNDDVLKIDSTLGDFEVQMDQLSETTFPFQFVLGAVMHSRHDLPGGFNLQIESDFSEKIGFGSSAAVTTATMAAIYAWRGEKLDKHDLFHTCRQIIRKVQGVGSGADLSASVFGGVVAYRPEPFYVEQICRGFPISVFYSGKKTTTPEVIKMVDRLREKYPNQVRDLFGKIGDITEEAIGAFRREDFESVGELMMMNQGLMDALGLCNHELADIVYNLRKVDGIVGAKISGAGLGDCAIGIGSAAAQLDKYEKMDVEISREGVCFE